MITALLVIAWFAAAAVCVTLGAGALHRRRGSTLPPLSRRSITHANELEREHTDGTTNLHRR